MRNRRRCPRCPGRRPLRRARGTCRSRSRPRPPRWAARAGLPRSCRTTRCTAHGAYRGGWPGRTRRCCQRRSRGQQATGRSPRQAANRLARTHRSCRCHRSRRTRARGEIADGPQARRPVAQAAPGHARPAPRRTRRQAAATAPWLSHVQFTRVTWISLMPVRRRRPGKPGGCDLGAVALVDLPTPPMGPLGPTQAAARELNFFRVSSLTWRAPLRNRTVDLLLTMDSQQTCGQQRPRTGCYPACASVAWKVREWLGEAGRGHH